MKTINDYKYSQRAVAPIIATLLMVAISVVGGILIFVFAQGFFTDTSIQSPQVESLEIFGYDARDRAGLRTHIFDPAATEGAAGGTPTISTAPTATTLGLRDGDAITVFVRNKGAGQVAIDRIQVFGSDYLWVATSPASTSAPANQKFSVSLDGLPLTAVAGSPVIGPGQDATIIIRYEQDTNGPVKVGRPIPVTIVTGSGATFTKQIQNGVTVG